MSSRIAFADALFNLTRDFDSGAWNELIGELSKRLLRSYEAGLGTSRWEPANRQRVDAWRRQVNGLATSGRGVEAFHFILGELAPSSNYGTDGKLLLRGLADAWASSGDPRLGVLVAEFGGVQGQPDLTFTRCQLKAGRSANAASRSPHDLASLFVLADDLDREISERASAELTQVAPVRLLEGIAVCEQPAPKQSVLAALDAYEKDGAIASTLWVLRALLDLSRHEDPEVSRRANSLIATREVPRAWVLFGVAVEAAASSDVPLEQLPPSWRLAMEFALPHLQQLSPAEADVARVVDQLQLACIASRRWFAEILPMMPASLKERLAGHPRAGLKLIGRLDASGARSAYLRRRIGERWRNTAEWSRMQKMLSGLPIQTPASGVAMLERCVSSNDKFSSDGVSTVPETADEAIWSALLQAWNSAQEPDSEEDGQGECAAFLAALDDHGDVLRSTHSRRMSSRTMLYWRSVYIVRVGEDAFLDGSSSAIEYLD
jgi:hypothetical protein